MVFFDVSGLGLTANAFNELLMAKGVRFSTIGNSRLRAVTHLEVSRAQIEEALRMVRQVIKEMPSS